MTGLTKAMLIIAIVFAGVIWLNVVMWRRMRRALHALEARTAREDLADDGSAGGGGGSPVDRSPSTPSVFHPGEGRGPVTKR